MTGDEPALEWFRFRDVIDAESVAPAFGDGDTADQYAVYHGPLGLVLLRPADELNLPDEDPGRFVSELLAEDTERDLSGELENIDQPVSSKRVTDVHLSVYRYESGLENDYELILETDDGWTYPYHRRGESGPWIHDRPLRPDGTKTDSGSQPGNCKAVREHITEMDL